MTDSRVFAGGHADGAVTSHVLRPDAFRFKDALAAEMDAFCRDCPEGYRHEAAPGGADIGGGAG